MANEVRSETREPSAERRHVWDEPKNVRRLIHFFWFVCALLFLADPFLHRHSSFEGGEWVTEGWIGYYCFYGFVACVLLVLIAKQMRRVLMRREDYYGD